MSGGGPRYERLEKAPVDPEALLLDVRKEKIDKVISHRTRTFTYLVAEDVRTRAVVGTVTGVDHALAFGDPENGTSLWCLTADPQDAPPGTGEALVRVLAERYVGRGRAYLDLSVMHDNSGAIALYRKLGFSRVRTSSATR